MVPGLIDQIVKFQDISSLIVATVQVNIIVVTTILERLLLLGMLGCM
jgi:hypothetical protein